MRGLSRMRAKPQAKPEPKAAGDMVMLKTTDTRTGKSYHNGPYASEMLKGWIERNAGNGLNYEIVG